MRSRANLIVLVLEKAVLPKSMKQLGISFSEAERT
jgi:hypothetical protein